MKKKLRYMQQMEEQRKKQLVIEFERKNKELSSIIQQTGRKTSSRNQEQPENQ